MKLKRLAIVFLVVSGFAASAVANALQEEVPAKVGSTTAADASDSRADPKDEVIVVGRKRRLRELTHDLARSEDAFFDAYNHLNKIPAFAVHCFLETPTDSHLSARECRPQFVDDAREADARSTLSILTSDSAKLPEGEGANQRINDRLRDYKKHLVEVVVADKTLRKMLQDYSELRKQYDAALKDDSK